MTAPDIWQILLGLSAVGIFSTGLSIERRLTRIETTLKLNKD